MIKSIEINESNYKDYCSLDIAAFSFAEPGAMGMPGGIEIIDTQGQCYYTNYCHGHNWIKFEHLMEIIPVLKDGEIFGPQVPAGWKTVYLGAGNHLAIKSDYYSQFEKEAHNRGIEKPVEYFKQWFEIMLELLGKTV